MSHSQRILLRVLPWMALLPGVASCDTPVAGFLASPVEASEIPAPVDPLATWLRADLPSADEMPGAISALRDAFRVPSTDLALTSLARVARTIPAAADWIPFFEAEIRAKGGDFDGTLRALDRIPEGTGIRERWGAATLVTALEGKRGPVDHSLVILVRREVGNTAEAPAAAGVLARLAARVETQNAALARELRIEAVALAPTSTGAATAARALAPVLGEVDDRLLAQVAEALEGSRRWSAAVPLRERLHSSPDAGNAPARRLALARARTEAGDGAGGLAALGAPSTWVDSPLAAEAGAVRVAALVAARREGEARTAVDDLERAHPRHVATARALTARGRALLGVDRDGARALFLRAAATGHRPLELDTPVLDLGLNLYEARRYDQAHELLSTFAEGHPRVGPRQQAAFWAGLSAGRAGRAEIRDGHLREAWALDPVSYYGARAGRLAALPPLPPLPPGPERTPLGEDGARELANAMLRLQLHIAVPTPGSYAWELERLLAHFGDRPDGVHALGEAMVETGLTIQAARYARAQASEGEAVRNGPADWDARLLRIAFPFPFEEEVHRAAGAAGLDPFFVAGLIRQESLFNADIRSSAGAVGLMQIMPATGRGLARQMGIPGFQTAHLERPATNLALGTRYLADQLRRFEREADALAAYNAGPARMARWRQQGTWRDPDLWVERIPFAETRGYVKAVTLNWSLSTALYGCGPEALEFCAHPVVALLPPGSRPAAAQQATER
jgi:soluble lytic murein transglycosylase